MAENNNFGNGPYNQGYNQQYGQYNQGYNPQYGPYNPQPPQKSKLPMVITVILVVMLLSGAVGFGAYKLIYPDSDTTMTAQSKNNNTTGITAGKEEETPEPTEPPAPVFPNHEASSTRGVHNSTAGANYYYPSYAVDGDMNTAWSPNRNIDLTPTYTLSAETKQHVSGVRMTNGYCKSMETYTKNRRITQVTVYYEGGSKTQRLNTDAYREMQEIRFDEPVDTSYIKIHVDDSIYGTWLDIAISEIEVF